MFGSRRFTFRLAIAATAPAPAQIFSNSIIMGMDYTAQAGASQQAMLHFLRVDQCDGCASFAA